MFLVALILSCYSGVALDAIASDAISSDAISSDAISSDAISSDAKAPEVPRETGPSRVSIHKPNFALMGTPNVKLSFSGKLRVFESLDLNVAYSELIFWDLFKPAGPLRDSNYNPEIFYRLHPSVGGAGLFSGAGFFSGAGLFSGAGFFDVGIYEHESNGMAHDRSRSWDRFYLRYQSRGFAISGSDARFGYSIKAWIPYRVEDDNDDLVRYRGYWEILLAYEDRLMLRIYPGGPSGVIPWLGGQELTFRTEIAGGKFVPLLVLQLFHGYAENLLDYRENRTAFRAGIGI